MVKLSSIVIFPGGNDIVLRTLYVSPSVSMSSFPKISGIIAGQIYT